MKRPGYKQESCITSCYLKSDVTLRKLLRVNRSKDRDETRLDDSEKGSEKFCSNSRPSRESRFPKLSRARRTAARGNSCQLRQRDGTGLLSSGPPSYNGCAWVSKLAPRAARSRGDAHESRDRQRIVLSHCVREPPTYTRRYSPPRCTAPARYIVTPRELYYIVSANLHKKSSAAYRRDVYARVLQIHNAKHL